MTFRILVTGAALLLATALPVAAQTSTTNPLKKPAPAAAAPAAAPKAAPTPAAAAPAAMAPKPAAAAAEEPKKEPSQAQKAQQAKMKSCAKEWNGMKKAGKTNGMTYREFSSDCLKKG